MAIFGSNIEINKARIVLVFFLFLLLLNLYLSHFEWTPNELFLTAIASLSQSGKVSIKPVYRSRLDKFFDNETVKGFQDHYLQQCARRQATGHTRMFAAMLNGRATNGFGSIISNALNAYLIAEEPTVNRTFALLEAPDKFPYSVPSELFQDFAGNSSCPLFVNLSSRNDLQAMEAFNLSINSTSQSVDCFGADKAVVVYFGPQWGEFRGAMTFLVTRDGIGNIFAAKSNLARAMWRPKPYLREILQKLWSKVSNGTGTYFAVHLRRGDKITAGEMEEIPLERYVSKLASVRNSSADTVSVHNVFVMHDDPAAFEKLRDLAAHDEFRLFELHNLLAGPEFDEVRGDLDNGQRGGDPRSRQRHTRELVLSMTLAAVADQIVCTFSSNLCRFIALLRGDLSVFHSLDSGWYAL